MITKELLSEVLGEKVIEKGKYFDNILEVKVQRHSYRQWLDINIYELTHKCKEWLMGLDKYWFEIEYTPRWHVITIKDYDNRGVVFCNGFNTESEAIFKACEWILENKGK